MNDITEDEQKVLEKEISNDSTLRKSFMSLLVFWKNFFPHTKQNSIIQKTEKKLGITYRLSSGTKINSVLRIAASIILIISVGFSAYTILKPKNQIALNEYGSGPGEVKEVVLSDGTKVWLNSTSLLIASEPFTGETREIKLFGEAYFEVAHNPEQPFIVHTRQMKTQVLGTHFNVV
ncbi:MAG: FecR family protein, partial [Draconibacterium sp.]|nr:FecR family protein [Draconibacterium sp.]